MDHIFEYIIDGINYGLENKYMYILITLVSGILIGYTLQPVPKWMDKMFNTSNFFKYLIIVMSGIVATYPIDKTKFIAIITISMVILVLLELIRDKAESFIREHYNKIS